MKISIRSFSGVFPRITPRGLPDDAAQIAINARLVSGDLESWLSPSSVQQLPKVKTPSTIVNSIWRMARTFWLHWTHAELGAGQTSVDVARAPIPGDVNEVTLFTGLDRPRITNLELATTQGADAPTLGAYPYRSYWLGVPAPSSAPGADIAAGQARNGIPIDNPGAEEGTTSGWSALGTFLVIENGTLPDLDAFAGSWFFGGGAGATASGTQDFIMDEVGVVEGNKFTLSFYQASGPNASTAQVRIEFFDSLSVSTGFAESPLQAIDPPNQWEQQTVTGEVPAGSVSFSIIQNYVRVGAGDLDAYIDEIVLVADTGGFASDCSSFDGFSKSATTSGNPGDSEVTAEQKDAGHGLSFKFYADERTAYVYLDKALDQVNFTLEYELYLESGNAQVFHYLTIGADLSGAGQGYVIDESFLKRSDHAAFAAPKFGKDPNTEELASPGSDELEEKWMRVTVTGKRTSESGVICNISVQNAVTGDVITQADGQKFITRGPLLIWKHWSNEGGPTAVSWIDNIRLTTTTPQVTDESVTTQTAYVYTFVNYFEHESAPSPASGNLVSTDGQSRVVTTTTTAPHVNWGIVKKRIYRAVTGEDGITQFLLVAEIPLAQADYIDSRPDSVLTDVLETDGYDLPPEDGHSILALPNGIVVMLSKNTLCPSVRNRPYAYPQAFRQPADSKMVAQGAVDTTVVAVTEGFPYLVLGSDPSQMSMQNLELPQGCVSKRSIVPLKGFGIIYASPDGLVAVTGPGKPEVITADLFSRREWQKINPSTLIGVAHDDRYIGFMRNPDPSFFGVKSLPVDPNAERPRGLIYDPKEQKFSWLSLPTLLPTPPKPNCCPEVAFFWGDDGSQISFEDAAGLFLGTTDHSFLGDSPPDSNGIGVWTVDANFEINPCQFKTKKIEDGIDDFTPPGPPPPPAPPAESLFDAIPYSGNAGDRAIVSSVGVEPEIMWIHHIEEGKGSFAIVFDGGVAKYWPLHRVTPDVDDVEPPNAIAPLLDGGFSLPAEAENPLPHLNIKTFQYVAYLFKSGAGNMKLLFWDGDGTAGRVLPHGLGAEPAAILLKVYKNQSPMPGQQFSSALTAMLWKNGFAGTQWGFTSTNVTTSASQAINSFSAAPDASNLYLGVEDAPSSPGEANVAGVRCAALLFADAPAGAVRSGNYIGTGATPGPTVELSWQPDFVLIRNLSHGGPWRIMDGVRAPGFVADDKPVSFSGGQINLNEIRLTGTGFQPDSTAPSVNAAGQRYGYLAIRRTATTVPPPPPPPTFFSICPESNGTLTPVNAEDDFSVLFGRASEASYRNAQGQLAFTTAAVPRIHHVHQVVNGDIRVNRAGVLMEAAINNQFLHSVDMTQAAWLKTGLTVRSAAGSPQGPTAIAYELVTPTGLPASEHFISQLPPANVSAGIPVCLSIWVRKKAIAPEQSITLRIVDRQDPNSFVTASFKPNGAPTGNPSMNAFITGVFGDARLFYAKAEEWVQADGECWWRCVLSGAGNQALVNHPIRADICFGAQAGINSFASNGEVLKVYGPQLEIANFHSSYIRTMAGVTARDQDTLVIEDINESGIFDTTQGTLEVQFAPQAQVYSTVDYDHMLASFEDAGSGYMRMRQRRLTDKMLEIAANPTDPVITPIDAAVTPLVLNYEGTYVGRITWGTNPNDDGAVAVKFGDDSTTTLIAGQDHAHLEATKLYLGNDSSGTRAFHGVIACVKYTPVFTVI